MATYRGSLILSPSVDIRPHLPPVKYLQQGINFQYRNMVNVDPTKPSWVELYLLDSAHYLWWDYAPNVYLPLYWRRPNFVLNGMTPRVRLLAEISTVKVWIAEYDRAIAYYTNEISRIDRLEVYFRKQYTITVSDDSVLSVVRIRDLYQSFLDLFVNDRLRLVAIQYEVEQRLVFFDANNALPTSNRTPEFAAYYPTTMNYSLLSYSGHQVPLSGNSIPRSYYTRYPTWHHLTPPETVTGNPYWGINDSDIRTYNKTNNLILSMDIRFPIQAWTDNYPGPINFENGSRIPFYDHETGDYHRYSYYENYPYRLAGRSPYPFYSDNEEQSARLFAQWKDFAEGVKDNQNKEVATTVTVTNEKFEWPVKSLVKPHVGSDPTTLKTQDGVRSYALFSYGLSLPAPTSINFPASTEYPVLSSGGDTWFSSDEITMEVNDGNYEYTINRWPQNSKPWYEFRGEYHTTDTLIDGPYFEETVSSRPTHADYPPLPGSANIALLPESIHKVINEDTEELFFKRSATIEYNTESITARHFWWQAVNLYTLTVKPEVPYTPVKIWYGSSVAKPVLPRVWIERRDIYPPPSPGLFPLPESDAYYRIWTVDNGPAWLKPVETPTASVIITRIEKTFVSNSLIEEYFGTWRYDDVAGGIPQVHEFLIYTITYDLTPA